MADAPAVAADLQAETAQLLQRLIRFNTVNPPGNERPAIEYLEAYVREAGFETELLAAEPERPNLIATLRGHSDDGPTMVYLGHVDTVLAHAEDWQQDPWAGEIDDGCLWGRGALDMKNQVAAEAVAAVSLARSGWRPARGTLKLVFVADEETGWRGRRRPLADSRAPGQGPLRPPGQRGCGRSIRFRGHALLRRLLRREGDLPLAAHRARSGRARLDAAAR